MIPDNMWIAPIPRCPTHKGQMSYNMPADRYECRGFDSEGCEYTIGMEELYWQSVGRTAQAIQELGDQG